MRQSNAVLQDVCLFSSEASQLFFTYFYYYYYYLIFRGRWGNGDPLSSAAYWENLNSNSTELVVLILSTDNLLKC